MSEGAINTAPSEGGINMKHNLKISVSKKPQTGGVVVCRSIALRERLLTFLFGQKQKVMNCVQNMSIVLLMYLKQKDM